MTSRGNVHFALIFSLMAATLAHAPLVVGVVSRCRCTAEGRICQCSPGCHFVMPTMGRSTGDGTSCRCRPVGEPRDVTGSSFRADPGACDSCSDRWTSDSSPDPCGCQISASDQPAAVSMRARFEHVPPVFESPRHCGAVGGFSTSLSAFVLTATLLPPKNLQRMLRIWRN